MLIVKSISHFIFTLLAFIALFVYLYPVHFKWLPCDTGMLLHMTGFVYFCFCGKVKHLNQQIFAVYLWTLSLLIMGLSTAAINGCFDFGVLRKVIAVVLYSFSAFLVIRLIRKVVVDFTFFKLLEWIVYVAFVQAILSFILFLNADIMRFYLDSIRLDDVSKDIISAQSSFRLIAVANTQYANMAVMYGIAFLSALTLPFSKRSALYQRKFLYYSIIFTILVAGILSARTFFLILLFSFVYFFYLLWKKKGIRVLWYGGGVVLVVSFLLIGGYMVLKNSEYERTFQWMFEWYINLKENGSLETSSSNRLKEMYFWPEDLKTWLVGDGRFQNENGSFYKSTDAGYLRNLFYWGILGGLLFYFVQYQYYIIVRKSTDTLLVKRFLGFLVIWFFLYNIKEFWYANMYWVLFLTALLQVKNGISLHRHI